MAHNLSDAQLADRISQEGSPEAEAELVRRMAPRIRLYGLRHLRDESAAEDLMQDVLINTIESLRAGRLRDPEKLASFVLGACRMTVLNLRRGVRRRAHLLEMFGADLLSAARQPEPALDRELLAHCVESLKERERTVIVMSYFDEQTGSGVASFLGLSEANVRVIRHRAVNSLRECMGAAT